jgi:hypothetical protein
MCTAASFPRFARTPECIERDARFGAAVEALRAGRRGLACRDFVLMEG